MHCCMCGRLLEDGTTVCPHCGSEQKQKKKKSYLDKSNYVYYTQESKALAYLALIFGISGGLVGIILGIVGLATYEEKDNRRLCKIGLAFSVFWIIIGILLFF